MRITFTVYGNHENPCGNPIPFQRALKQHMRGASVRYLEWQSYVRAGMFDWAEKNMYHIRQLGHPILLEHNQRARMDIVIYWASNAHGDPDNVWKGIADSLFKDDKNLAGSFDFKMAENGAGRVDITIKIDS